MRVTQHVYTVRIRRKLEDAVLEDIFDCLKLKFIEMHCWNQDEQVEIKPKT